MDSWEQLLIGVEALNCVFNDRVAEKCQAEKRRLYWCDYNPENIEIVIQNFIHQYQTTIVTMARSTRRTTPRAPTRALRSRSLGAGTRNDNGPGSRASARAQNVGQVVAGEAVAAEEAVVNRNQNNNREDQAVADLEAMRVEQA